MGGLLAIFVVGIALAPSASTGPAHVATKAETDALLAHRRASDGIEDYMRANGTSELEMESRSGMKMDQLTNWVAVYLQVNKTSDPTTAINDTFHTAKVIERAARSHSDK